MDLHKEYISSYKNLYNKELSVKVKLKLIN